MKGWLTVKDLVELLRFPSNDACRKWIRREKIARVRRGRDARTILVHSRDLDRVLKGR